MRTWVQASLSILCLIIITNIAYYDSLNNGLLTMWDDQGYVIYNQQIRALNWETVQWFFTHIQMHNWHPLTSISYAIDYHFWQLDPWGYHFTNLLFHNANVIWLFFTAWLLFRIFDHSQQKQPIILASTLTALLLAIHPQHVESVAWVSERKDVLFLFFTFPTIIAYIYYTQTYNFFYYFIALSCFILALLSKPMAITLPAVLVLLDIFPLKRTNLTHIVIQGTSYTRILLEKLPFMFLSIASIMIALLAQRTGGENTHIENLTENGEIQLAGGAIQSLEQLTIDERLLNAASGLIHYITKMLFPLQLSPYYDLPEQFSAIPVFVVIAITFLFIFLWLQKNYVWLIAWLFYVGTLLPVIGIIQVGGQAAADRYAYLPLLAFYLIIGYVTAKYLFHHFKTGKKLYVTVIFVVIITLTFSLISLTQKQVLVWRNDYSLWKHAYLYDDKNTKAITNLAALHRRAGDNETALKLYQAAIRAKPDILSNYNRLAEFYVKLGQINEALDIYEKMDAKDLINTKGSVAQIYFNMAMLYYQKNEIDKAIAAAEKSLIRNPDHEQAQRFLHDYQTTYFE